MIACWTLSWYAVTGSEHHDIEMLTRENMIIQYPSHRDSDAHCNYGAAQSLESESRCLGRGAVYHESQVVSRAES
jgi:hypothetical protein